jgi:hypothetical protein
MNEGHARMKAVQPKGGEISVRLAHLHHVIRPTLKTSSHCSPLPKRQFKQVVQVSVCNNAPQFVGPDSVDLVACASERLSRLEFCSCRPCVGVIRNIGYRQYFHVSSEKEEPAVGESTRE